MEEKETGRLEAFSDGVFAVAITLLVLNLKIPGLDTDDSQTWRILRNELPMFAAYVTSFVTIGVMWLNHHRLFTYIKRTDTGLILLNLLLLMIVVFIPFPTALVAEYLFHPEQHAAAILYSGTNVILAVCYNLLWRYASYQNRFLSKNADARMVESITKQYMFGPLLYLFAFLLALFSTPASVTLNFLLALFFALPPRLPPPVAKQLHKREGDA